MDVIDERFLIYTAVMIICSALATFAGLTAGVATFSVVTVGIEFAYWSSGVMNAPDQPTAAN
ncbi:hypothetical protein N9R27_01065 [Flavobacteriaceae bacterium]|nr:hypothetical protein [Flavobacteriaceae bacterium]|tara:strand:- start:456 stop:641 length:186 start_codon:yes stop_codon:yes gene_type:complete